MWPLTTVKRWAASPNSFTLDFGDYSESYYSVQTTEGEQISQLIAGYIDIILKKKKGQDHLGIDGDEEELMVDDFLSPRRATIVQHQNTGTLLKGEFFLDAASHLYKWVCPSVRSSVGYDSLASGSRLPFLC